MTTVSIVVPCYNIAQFIGDCISSIVNQTFKDWELILVDDGSTDNTGEICDRLAALHSNFKVIHQQNLGVSAARRTGLLCAHGSWVMFVDGDDTLPEYALEIMVNICTATNVDIFVGSRNFHTDKCYVPKIIKLERYGVYIREEYVRLLADYKIPMGLQSKLFKKDLLDKVDFLIPRIITNNEDYLYNLFISSYISHVYISQEPVYNYNIQQSNNARDGRATTRQYHWSYWEEYFTYLHENYKKYNISDDTYIRSVLTKLNSLIRNNQDYRHIKYDIPPFDCISNVKPFKGFNFWQSMVIIIYSYRKMSKYLILIMRFHPKKMIRNIVSKC